MKKYQLTNKSTYRFLSFESFLKMWAIAPLSCYPQFPYIGRAGLYVLCLFEFIKRNKIRIMHCGTAQLLINIQILQIRIVSNITRQRASEGIACQSSMQKMHNEKINREVQVQGWLKLSIPYKVLSFVSFLNAT